MNNFGKNTPQNNEPENPGRRGFIRGVLGGAIVTVFGVKGINKYLENEIQEELKKPVEEMNQEGLNKYFGNDIEDLSKVNHAVNIILIEMNKEGLDKISLNSGTNVLGGNGRLDVSRDFLTKHLNSKVGSKYPVKGKIFSSRTYKKEDLVELLSLTTK